MWKFLMAFVGIPLLVSAQDSLDIHRKTRFSGQWRTYYMATTNKGNLTDYKALATGGNLKFKYRPTKNLELGAAIYNATNVGLQDLTIPDATTGRVSRYEEGLFDRLDLKNDALFLLGELYLNYTLKNHAFTLGRMNINTPLINPQDGRMIPTLVQGFWYTHRAQNANRFQFGLLNKIAPRSTGSFYGIGESIGTYPVGRDRRGQEAKYFRNTRSEYILLMNAEVRVTETIRLDIWNQYTENISNSFYLKPKFNISDTFSIEGEWLHQNKVGNGGNAIDSLRYFDQKSSDVLGLRLSRKKDRSLLSLAYERILSQGQFLSPREWGREDFFSFQKRERSEGSADNHALIVYLTNEIVVRPQELNLNSIVSIGRHWKANVTDATLNKYAIPDYTHINVDLFMDIKKLKGFRPELLLTAKLANGAVPDNANFFFNKVDMYHINLILNYNF